MYIYMMYYMAVNMHVSIQKNQRTVRQIMIEFMYMYTSTEVHIIGIYIYV